MFMYEKPSYLTKNFFWSSNALFSGYRSPLREYQSCQHGSGIAEVFDLVELFCIFIRLLHRTGGKIKNLTIVNCNLERLYGDVFRTNKITKLVIRDTPIRFYLLPEVKTVVIFATFYFKSPSLSPNLGSSGSNAHLKSSYCFAGR